MPIQNPNPWLARRRRLVVFALTSAVVALIAAVISVFNFSLAPPKVQMRPLQVGAAVTNAVVKLDPAIPLNTGADFESQAKRAALIANVMTSPPIVNRIGHLTGIEANRIAATVEADQSVPRDFIEPDSERRANQILLSHDPYKLDIQPQPNVPVLDIYTQAPSVGQAEALANASVKAANAYLSGVAIQHHLAGSAPVSLTQLGSARGALLDPTAPLKIAALTFVVAFAITFGLLNLLAEIRRGWLRAGRPFNPLRPSTDQSLGTNAPVRSQSDDWPHTTRILPWLIAGFIVMLWLVPVNAIWIQASLPVDLKLDRLVIPVIVVVWLVALAAGRQRAPRWHFTRIHAAIALFVAVAFLSVVLNAAYLNQTLELGVSIKKLLLLTAFFSIFLVVASVVRPSEVRAFMTFTLVLGTICAVGVLWEYRFGTDLFYSWASKVLPGFFHIAAANTSADEIGRPEVVGPADVSLEVVAMLSMALPIAVVRLMHSSRTRERVLCGLAICILLGAMIATYRKSALLAPITVFLIIAYFRRRELLRLAPVGAIVLVAIPVLAPHALGSIVEEFQPNHLGVGTVDDRVSDYDAIRPDLLSHPAFGRGFGSYEHTSYRILDNDLLMRVVETGLIGLAAFILMLVLIIAAAAPIIRKRDQSRAPPALAVAAAAGAFLVLSALFDIMSFPQTPYLLMVLAGFLAVVSRGGGQPSPRRPQMALAEPWQHPVEVPAAPEPSFPTIPTAV
jgi:hypothetical protein